MVTFITIPLTFWIGWAPVIALLLGYTSHLLGDAATKSGIRLLYPSKARFYALPLHLRLTTGSFAEEALLPVLGLTVFLLLLTHLPFN